jgi:hypothetical protein
MKEKKIYICEKCGEEFNRTIECENHEVECMDKKLQYDNNVKNTVVKLKQKYGSLIINAEYNTKVDMSSCENDIYYIYKFEIKLELSNGNTVLIYDGMDKDLRSGNYLEENIIIESAKNEIEKCLPTSYEGIINWKYEDGWRIDRIGDMEINDIVNRLRGRKVKIEAI